VSFQLSLKNIIAAVHTFG